MKSLVTNCSILTLCYMSKFFKIIHKSKMLEKPREAMMILIPKILKIFRDKKYHPISIFPKMFKYVYPHAKVFK